MSPSPEGVRELFPAAEGAQKYQADPGQGHLLSPRTALWWRLLDSQALPGFSSLYMQTEEQEPFGTWGKTNRIPILHILSSPKWCPQASQTQTVKNLHAMQETWVQSLGWEDPLEEGMATHSSTLAWEIPWTEEPGGLQTTGLPRVGHDWATNTHTMWNQTYLLTQVLTALLFE